MRLGLGLGLSTALSSGTASFVIAGFAPVVSDDFEGAQQFIIDRGGGTLWTMPDFAGTRGDLSDGDPNWFVNNTAGASGGFLHMTSNNKNTTALNPLILGASTFATTSDISVDFGYDSSGQLYPTGTITWTGAPSQRARFRFWALDKNNYLEIQIDDTNKRLILGGKLSGGAITSTYWHGPRLASLSWKPQGAIHVQIKSNVLRIALDGVWLTSDSSSNGFPCDAYTIPNYAAAGKNMGPPAFVGVTSQNAFMDYISAQPLDVSIDFIDQFVGRDSTTATGGTARLEISYNGTPVTWIGRVLKKSDGSVVSDWATLKNVTANGAGKIKGGIFLPLSNNLYYCEIGYLDASGILHYSRSRDTCSGYKIAGNGQSNSTGRVGRTFSGWVGGVTGALDPSILAAAYVADLDTGITPRFTPTTSGGAVTGQTREVGAYWSPEKATGIPSTYNTARVLSSIVGAPIGIQTLGSASTSIVVISDATTPSTNWTDFRNALTWAPGIVEAMIWDQGEANADSSYLCSGPMTGSGGLNYSQVFDVMRSNLRNAAVCPEIGNPNLPIVISLVGRYASTGAAPPSDTIGEPGREALRQQHLACAANDPLGKTWISDSKLGVPHPSGNAYHYSDVSTNGYDEINRRCAYSLAKYAFGANVYDGRGPLITSAARSGATITLGLDLNGSASLVEKTASTGDVFSPAQSNTVKGYQVSADGFATLLPITSVALDGVTNTSIIITLASAPGAPVQVRSFYGYSYDDSTIFWGTGYADGRADLPVFPLFRNGTQLTSN